MIQLYSEDLTVNTGGIIKWNTKAVQRGYTATLNKDGQTINLNAPGVYEISVNAYGATTAAGEFALQLVGDGVEIARAVDGITTATGALEGNVSFSTLVAVNGVFGSNANAAITLEYTGNEGVLYLANIVVKKVA